jgi:DNA-directed RNA polymerase specialized sigma24 family protein
MPHSHDPRRKNIDPETLRRMAREGYTAREIAEELKVREEKVRDVAHGLRLTLASAPPKGGRR